MAAFNSFYNSGTSGWITSTATTTSNCTTSGWSTIPVKYSVSRKDLISDADLPLKIRAGKQDVELPDGAKLLVDDLGNYRIEDKDAKVTYRANRIREFSPHLNASDMLAQFVSYVGTLGVKRADVLGLPLHLFISWLIIEAAQRDGDPVPSDVMPVASDPVLRLAMNPKCLCCGRFIRRLHYQNKFSFCSPEHGRLYLESRQPLSIAP